ncbi:MAG: hypothetical protein OXF78_10805 [Rhodospirillales bacterium]|nr:hypothetical protein [Rhodospirillales bacterium]
MCHDVREAREDECGTPLPGDVLQDSDQFGGAIVEVRGSGEIADHDVVALDVRADEPTT